jgi:hypothetical protein
MSMTYALLNICGLEHAKPNASPARIQRYDAEMVLAADFGQANTCVGMRKSFGTGIDEVTVWFGSKLCAC